LPFVHSAVELRGVLARCPTAAVPLGASISTPPRTDPATTVAVPLQKGTFIQRSITLTLLWTQ
jgi:hypothetical protein